MRWLRRYWLEIAWALFVGANATVIWFISQWETVPFHLVWLSTTILYWFRPWRLRTTAIVLACIVVASGSAFGDVVTSNGGGWDEVTEIPMMALIYAVTVWFARNRLELTHELERMVARQRKLIRDASHVLRTPITVARGHAELAGTSLISDPAQAGRDLTVVMEELDRLVDISDRLMLLIQSEEGSHPEEEIDLDAMLSDVARRWRTIAPRVWDLRLESRLSIVGDAHRLNLAIDELVENALRATTAGDRIAVVSRDEGSAAVVDVSDSGVGIAAEHRDRLFDPFVHSALSRRNGAHGPGVGLSIVKAIVESYGGSIGVETRPGWTTTFCIRLPHARRLRQAAISLPGEPVAGLQPTHSS